MSSNILYQVVILAGGLATRLYPVTKTLPKSLLEINGKPFIYHQLNLLQKKGIKKVVLCVGYLGKMIQDYVGDGAAFGLQVAYSFDGNKLLGTGGALKCALSLLSDQFFVLYGDSFLDCDYIAIQQQFEQEQKLGLMTIFNNQNQWDRSNIEYAHGKIIKYDKLNTNKRMNYIDYGLGILQKSAVEKIYNKPTIDLVEIYQDLIRKKQITVYEVKERFYEIGSFAGIETLRHQLMQTQKAI